MSGACIGKATVVKVCALLGILSSCLLPPQAEANQLLFSIAGMKNDEKTEGPTIGNNDSQMTAINFKGGYILANGLYVGGAYDTRTDQSGSTQIERSSAGASIGYHNSGWYIDGTYYLTSNRKAGSNEYKEGSGFGADVGHRFAVSDPLHLGLQVSYRSFGYSKVNNTTETNKISSELMPMLLIALVF